MLHGRLQEKSGYFYMVIYNRDKGKKTEKWISTKLKSKGNRRKAELLLSEYLLKLNNKAEIGAFETFNEDILFGDYLLTWVKGIKNTIEPITYAGYLMNIEKTIAPYFNERGIMLKKLNGRIIDEFYNYMLERVSANSVIHYHAYIRKSLQDAFKNDLIPCNFADKAHRPKKTQYIGSYYNKEQLIELFDLMKGSVMEFPVMMAGYYGLRRSEIIGLKWSCVDYNYKTISIRHTVSEYNLEGKRVICAKDRAKTKKSLRTLPLIPPIEELLEKMRKYNKFYEETFGARYDVSYSEYIYRNEFGKLIAPDFVSHKFKSELRRLGLPEIRFHDLRHSCAALLRHEGVPMEDIQKWLGHSQISTTESIYAHFENEIHLKSAAKVYSALSKKPQSVQS